LAIRYPQAYRPLLKGTYQGVRAYAVPKVERGAMDDNLTKAKHYRDEAENLRKLAALDDNAETREALLSVARTYDRLHVKYLGLGKPKTP
jgi:hypothetical protein